MSTSARPRLTITRSPAEAARATAERVVGALRAARAERGAAHLSLAGGRTPRAAYEILGPLLGDWDGVHLWFGDERCVPPDDPESNYRLVAESLLPGASVPPERVHRIEGERAPLEAARAYADELRRVVPAGDSGVPVLDVALLGLGEDGHTASLFPGDPALERHDALAFPVRAVKPPPDRITLSLDVLRAARAALLLAEGAGKADAVARVLAAPDPAVPASLLARERTELVVDEAAASRGVG
jgi:6-phosphogluconolactonase